MASGFPQQIDHGLTMPVSSPQPIVEHPPEGFRSTVLPTTPRRPVRVYLPTDYQPKYAYPLVVLFHADGETEGSTAWLVPLLSRRNYVALCLRGPVPFGLRADGHPSFGWGASAAAVVCDVRVAVAHVTTTYSIHPNRIFLAGIGEGATAALWFAAADEVAGVVLLNPRLPERLPAVRFRLPVLVGHGSANPVVPLAAVRAAAARLTEGGSVVRLNRYAAADRVHPDMLRDANRWIMSHIASSKE